MFILLDNFTYAKDDIKSKRNIIFDWYMYNPVQK